MKHLYNIQKSIFERIKNFMCALKLKILKNP